jgi:hypothetical protein
MRRQQIQVRGGDGTSRDIDTDSPLLVAQSYARVNDDFFIAGKTIPEILIRVGQWLEAHDLITVACVTD